MSQYKIFSYIDLKSAFHQFRFDPSEYHLTAFEAAGRLWEFTCIPFGLRNSPAAFSRALSGILCDLPGVFIYMDDVVVGGKDLEEHDANLNKLFRSASEAYLILSSEKCAFRGTSLRFLGHLVYDGTIKPDPQRSAPFLNFPVPSSVKQLERFIGLAVYLAKWVPCFSRILDPLFSALQKSLPLSLAARNAISQIKQAINRAILYIVNRSKPLTLSTDASADAIGAILSQEGRPVAYVSAFISNSKTLVPSRIRRLRSSKSLPAISALSSQWTIHHIV